MREINQGGRAFPWCGDLNDMPSINLGMTMRDYFAAKAMQGLIAQSCGMAVGSDPAFGAKYAYQMADAMLKARES